MIKDAFDKINLNIHFINLIQIIRIFDNLLYYITFKIIKSLNDYKINSFECRNTVEDYRDYYKKI